MTTKKCSAEKICKKSPNGEHCWHVINSPITIVLCIPGGTTKINEICCWCNEKRSYDYSPKFSQNFSIQNHGPYFQIKPSLTQK